MSNIEIRDLELVNKFDQLYINKVFLYGAGVYGMITLTKLKEIGVVVAGFVDGNEALHGSLVGGVEVFSPDELAEISKIEEIVVIISTEKYADEVIKFLDKKGGICQSIYTLYGFNYAVYFNMDNFASDVRKKYRDSFQIWQYNRGLESYRDQARLDLSMIVNNEASIVVFQPGKVGSKTVAATLRHYGIPAVHSHGILFATECAGGGLELKENLVRNILHNDRTIKLISLVRDPIAKDIGHFFQKISNAEGDVGWFVKGIIKDNFEESFKNYLSVVTPFDFSSGKKKVNFEEKMICHIDYIGKKSPLGAFWGWFEEELKNTLGIDVLAYQFDKEKGYSIIRQGNIELLIMQVEKLNCLESVLADFVGVEEIKLVNVNKGEEKAYRYVYKQFKQEVELPREYVEFCYNNQYMEHFYSKEDREKFYDKWEKHIVD